MNALRPAVGAVVAALAMSAAAGAKTIPNGDHGPAQSHARAKKPAATVVAPARSRILCICIVRTTPWPGIASAPASEEEFERQYDADMVAHSLEPVFGPARAASSQS